MTLAATTTSRKIFYCHPLPQRPIVLGVVSPHIQPVRNSLGIQNGRKLDVLVQTNVPVGRSQDDVHRPVAAEKPIVTHVWQKIGWAVEVTVVIVVPIQKLMDIESAAHAHTVGHYVGMLKREIYCMVTAETAARNRQPVRIVLPS